MSPLLAPIEHRRQGFHPTLIHSPTRTGWPPSQQPTTADMAMCLHSSLLRHTRLSSSLIPATTRRMQPRCHSSLAEGERMQHRSHSSPHRAHLHGGPSRQRSDPDLHLAPLHVLLHSHRPLSSHFHLTLPAQHNQARYPISATNSLFSAAGARMQHLLCHSSHATAGPRKLDACSDCSPLENQPRSSKPPTMGMPLHLDDV